jgi:hypothetical protein
MTEDEIKQALRTKLKEYVLEDARFWLDQWQGEAGLDRTNRRRIIAELLTQLALTKE